MFTLHLSLNDSTGSTTERTEVYLSTSCMHSACLWYYKSGYSNQMNFQALYTGSAPDVWLINAW